MHRPIAGQALSRCVLCLVASFAFTWGFVALGVAGASGLGADYHQAETAMMLLALPVFLPLFLWTFASRRQPHAWAVPGGGAALMAGAAWLLQRALAA